MALAGGISDEETEALMDLPAVFSNWFFTHPAGDGLRITFAEKGAYNGLPHPRAAVVLSFGDLVLLKELIDNALAVREDKAPRITSTDDGSNGDLNR